MSAPKSIVIRLSALTHAAIKLKAHDAGQSMQTYIERLLCKDTRTPVMPDEGVESLRKTLRTLHAEHYAALSAEPQPPTEDDDNELGSPYKGPNAIPRPPKAPVKLADIAAEWEED